jgi:hypothetical protein
MRYGKGLVVVIFLVGALAIGGDGPKVEQVAPVTEARARSVDRSMLDRTIPRARTVEEQLSRSAEGLREVPSPVPNGGTMVHLRGRFKDTMVLTSEVGEPLEARCVNDASMLHEPGEEREPAADEVD